MIKITILRDDEEWDTCYADEYDANDVANKWINHYKRSDTVNAENHDYTYKLEEANA